MQSDAILGKLRQEKNSDPGQPALFEKDHLNAQAVGREQDKTVLANQALIH